MDQRHRKAIKKNLVALSKDVDFDSLVPHLYAHDIYPADGKLEAFRVIPEKPKQNTTFLMDIQTRGPRAFKVLVQSLCEINQRYCADWIDSDYKFHSRESEVPSQSSKPTQESMGRNNQLDDVDVNRGQHVSIESVSDSAPWEKKPDDCYSMIANPRGILLLINNEVFLDDSLQTREGTKQDCDSMENLFRDNFGFLIVKKQNLTLAQMRQLYYEYGKWDHSAYSCFVSIILSHGLQNGVCGTDYNSTRNEVLMMEEVVKAMDDCPSLMNKPKVFITQACRGEKVHVPVSIQTDARRPSVDIERDRLAKEMGKMELNEKDNEPTNLPMKTNEGADVLIVYPSLKGYAAAREPDSGTWFIKGLCKVLKEHAANDDINSMLTMVNNEVANNRGLLSGGSLVTQTSEYTSTLRKKLYLPPVYTPGKSVPCSSP